MVKAAAAVLTCSVLVLASAACEAKDPPTRSATSSPMVGASPTGSPATDVDRDTHRVGSITQVLQILDGLGWEEVLVFERGRPYRLMVWESGGHLHARTDYIGYVGVSLIQAEGEGLPPGVLVEVRGEDGVRADGNLYWTERDFVISLSPGQRSLAASLTWIAA